MELTVNKTAIFANTGGQDFDPAKPVFVLVHGAGMDHTVWGAQSRYLANRGFSVLSIDLPGHGKSGGEVLTSIEALGDFLGDLITTAGAEKAILVGHSMGALACLQAAAAHAEKVSGLVLCGVAAKMPVHPELLALAEANDVKAAELIASWGHGSAAQKGGNDALGIWMIGTAIRLIDKSPPGSLAKDLAACAAYQTAVDQAAKVTCPTLLLLGGEDKMSPVKAAAPLMEVLDRAEQHVIADSGHMMMLEAPEITRVTLRDFAEWVQEQEEAA